MHLSSCVLVAIWRLTDYSIFLWVIELFRSVVGLDLALVIDINLENHPFGLDFPICGVQTFEVRPNYSFNFLTVVISSFHACFSLFGHCLFVF